jgi:hypothetical protein
MNQKVLVDLTTTTTLLKERDVLLKVFRGQNITRRRRRKKRWRRPFLDGKGEDCAPMHNRHTTTRWSVCPSFT